MHEHHRRTIRSLAGVSPRLAFLLGYMASQSPVAFVVIEGIRSQDRQDRLRAAGKSWVKESKHQRGTAIDLAVLDSNGQIDWQNIAGYQMLGDLFLKLGKEYGVHVVWGGSWRVRDYGHFEIL